MAAQSEPRDPPYIGKYWLSANPTATPIVPKEKASKSDNRMIRVAAVLCRRRRAFVSGLDTTLRVPPLQLVA
jgi:hypothetical protein